MRSTDINDVQGFKKRIIVIMFVFAGLLLLVGGKIFYLQVINGPDSGQALAGKALKHRSQYLAAEEYYRGEILDRNLLSLTDSGVRPTLVAFPGSIRDPEKTYLQLADTFGLSAGEIAVSIKRGQDNHGNRTPVILKENLSAEEVQTYQENRLPGIAVLPVKTRYGANSVAKHLVGYVNSLDAKQWQELSAQQKTIETNSFLATAYRITDKIGVAGLEAKYEEALKGSRAENRISGIADANGRLLEGLGYKEEQVQADVWRHHLVLTLDRRCQEIVERVMDENIVRGAVVVIDIPSGDVLALASRPDFNQNEVEKYIDGIDELIDRTERTAFYPGSVFKMVVAAGVLEEKLVQPGEMFTCSGSYTFPDETRISCLSEHGELNIQDAIIKSCNSTFIQLGLRLGNTRLAHYAAKLGFQIDLTAQSPPALVGNASIGQQGVLVSPLQIANLYATIARDGLYRPCRSVAQIRNYQGEVVQDFPLSLPEQVLKPSTCTVLKEALVKATRDGTGKQAWVKEKGTAGKTGTAQVNEAGKVIAWYAGYTPIDQPRLAIVVMVEERKDHSARKLSGGEAAAPVFREIAAEIFQIPEYAN